MIEKRKFGRGFIYSNDFTHYHALKEVVELNSNELGVASSLGVKHLSGDVDITNDVNKWLYDNPDVEVIEMKFATSATNDEWASDVLIIYRKEN